MKLSILAASTLFFTLAQSAPVTIEPVIGPADRHIIRHTHKINCLSCFCGHNAIERARHACPADRDLIVCPPSIPVRACYRCACHPRIPVSPSPPIMKPHSEDDHPEDDRPERDHPKDDRPERDHPERDHPERDHPERDHPERDHPERDHPEGDDEETDDMLMHTPYAEEDMESMPSKNMPTMKPHPTAMVPKPHPTMMPKVTKKPHPTKASEPTKKPHPTMTTKATKNPHPTMAPEPTRKPHPTMITKATTKPHPTNQTQAPTKAPSSKDCASFSRGGGGGNTMFDVDLLKYQGTFKISWEMDTVPDMIEIFYEDEKIFSTEVPVSGHGSAYVDYSGMSSRIRVWVTSPTSATGWFLSIGCPKNDH